MVPVHPTRSYPSLEKVWKHHGAFLKGEKDLTNIRLNPVQAKFLDFCGCDNFSRLEITEGIFDSLSFGLVLEPEAGDGAIQECKESPGMCRSRRLSSFRILTYWETGVIP